MMQYGKGLGRLILGLALYGLGAVMTMKANLGYAPWEVFHSGIAITLGISIGVVSILAGACFVVLAAWLGEKIGMGTLLNMVLIGSFMDLFLYLDWIPVPQPILGRLLLLLAGMFVIALASFFYMGAAFGAGPRDSLMVALMRRTGLSVGICRTAVEGSAVFLGWLLGGSVGYGTIIAAFGSGLCLQLTFSALHFDAEAIQHETLDRTLKKLAKNPIKEV